MSLSPELRAQLRYKGVTSYAYHESDVRDAVAEIKNELRTALPFLAEFDPDRNITPLDMIEELIDRKLGAEVNHDKEELTKLGLEIEDVHTDIIVEDLFG